MMLLISLFITALIIIAALVAWRSYDRHLDNIAWKGLVEMAGPVRGAFAPEMVESLPEPAQRYFSYTIRTGAPLYPAVEIEMMGELGLGTKDSPNYRPMSAHQILAPPHGLVWKLKAGSISGSDGATPQKSWTRFWLFGLIPIIRVGGNADHHRSAFGRLVSEGAFWVPASLLPSEWVKWEALDQNRARAIISHRNFRQAVDITIAENGQPMRVVMQRWSNENPDKIFREQPFGGDLSKFEDFDGYRLPTRVDGGNHIDTEAYFPFYKVTVTAMRFRP